MSGEKIHILIASDINYAAYYGVFLTSLFENNRDSVFVIHVFADESWNDRYKEQYKSLVEKYHSDILFYQVNSGMVKGMPEIANHYMTLTTYYLLFAKVSGRQWCADTDSLSYSATHARMLSG